LAFDPLRYEVCDRCESFEYVGEESIAREHRHHSDQTILYNQWIAGERNQPLPGSPLLVTHAWIVQHVISQVRLFLFSDQTNLQLPHRDTTMRTVEVGVHPGAGLQLQRLLVFRKRPYSSKRCVEMLHNGFHALPKSLSE